MEPTSTNGQFIWVEVQNEAPLEKRILNIKKKGFIIEGISLTVPAGHQ